MGYVEGFAWPTARDRDLAALFYRHLDPQDLASRDPATVVGCVEHLLAAAGARQLGLALVAVDNPSVAHDGWSCGRTVVTVVTDDSPFLVDSITAELNRLGVGIHLVVHPIVAVVRDDAGRLVEAGSPGPAGDVEPGRGAGILESWMHIEVDWQAEPAARQAIGENLRRVLADVRRAVSDWPRMVEVTRELAAALVVSPPRGIARDEVEQVVALLNWLADDHFTFLGYREYGLSGLGNGGEDLALVSEPGSGLGLLRSERAESTSFADLPPEVRRRALEPRLLILTKANRRSTVHRPVYLDYVGVKRFDDSGRVIGEHRFIGLFSASAYTQSVARIPVIDRKVTAARIALGFSRSSHSGRDLMQFLETFPRDELFAIEVDELVAISEAALNLKERRATRLFLRRDPYERFLSCLVYLPRDRYTTDVRLRIQAFLADQLGAEGVDYTARVTESVLARLHIVVRMPAGVPVPQVDAAALEAGIARIVRSWEDDLAELLVERTSESGAHDILRRFPQGFPQSYRAGATPQEAVLDIAALDRLTPAQPTEVALLPPSQWGGSQANARLRLYSRSDFPLAQVLPVLTSLGAQVVSERPFELVRVDDAGTAAPVFVFDIGLRMAAAERRDLVAPAWEDAFLACWEGRCERDGFNALVGATAMDWRRISVLRAYARYLRQAGSAFSQEYVEAAVLANPQIAGLLVQLFLTRFDPDFEGDRDAAAEALRAEVLTRLDAVASLDQDRILRSFLGLVGATLRTNHFQPDRPALALKLNPAAIRELPEPRPAFEIWVCSPRVEGVHLRFGRVARGGLRWSDRREDFRTEILGLVKAQAVKNAVIVPVGAKGGFYAKALPDPSDREAWLAEAVGAYRDFVGSLLDLTDNRVAGAVVPPPRVVRHDGDDPYLVVAADKGTATFSDIANEVAAGYGYWLGDAFASGGSEGFDHKAMGITARGAWESVRAHFRALGRDIEGSAFTAVGIGDMSGDVFGNGMLLSTTMRLVAAFDHRHVFLDPDPDPLDSHRERQRLFCLPRSSWADYDPALISPGGGVHPRSAKSVPISPQVRAVLGLGVDVTALTPAELIRAILMAPVDLLWNGGIGTYVKASGETHAEAGDRANDAIRIDGRQLRARVVGEGGNLGLTQRGRIEAARSGVTLNTDAIDNSAGVDTSDHEVNIKILLDLAAAEGRLDRPGRRAMLAAMTDEVAALVLRDNVEQNVLIHLKEFAGAGLVPALARLIASLERTAGLDRSLEALPSDSALAALAGEGRGLTSPELAVVSAHTKLDLKAALLASTIPDEAFTAPWLGAYFPATLVERFPDLLERHPLRREIIATGLANELVNRGGLTYALRATEESGATLPEVARAFAAARDVFDLPGLWARIEGHEGQVPAAALNALRMDVERLLDRATRWFLQYRGGRLDVLGEVRRMAGPVRALSGSIPSMLIGVERERLDRRARELVSVGAPPALAGEVAALLDVFCLLDVVEVARRNAADPEDVARLYFTISERFEVDRYLVRITALPRDDRWSALARAALRSDLYGALAALTHRVIRATPDDGSPIERVLTWERRNAEGLRRARATLTEVGQAETFDLVTLSVALRVIRTLALGR